MIKSAAAFLIQNTLSIVSVTFLAECTMYGGHYLQKWRLQPHLEVRGFFEGNP